jgi:hypothetical protein
MLATGSGIFRDLMGPPTPSDNRNDKNVNAFVLQLGRCVGINEDDILHKLGIASR